MLLMGILGGMAYGAIPALLKIRFGTNEILTSLMLVYVAGFLLDWLARGPWRNPAGFNFPNSRQFSDGQLLPVIAGQHITISIVFALVAAVAAWFLLRKTLTGFQIRVLGQAPRAGAFAGFSQNRMILLAFLISGGLAGLAGICEVAGPLGQLRISVSPGYGFTAIIVAFLGRLNPLGIIAAGFVLALSYLGGEGIQSTYHLSEQIARVFQGLLLFFVLACDTLIFYRMRIVRPQPARAAHRRRLTMGIAEIQGLLLTIVTAAMPLLFAATRRTGHRALRRPQPRRRGHDGGRRGDRLHRRLR